MLRHARTILTTSTQFANVISCTDLKTQFEQNDFSVVFVDNFKQLTSTQLFEILVVVVEADKFGARDMGIFPHLKLIIRFGAGYDNIDLDAAAKSEIMVANAPAMNHKSVAQFSALLMLALSRRLIDFNQEVKRGKWQRVYNKTLIGMNLGIIGLGRIGKELAKIALGFGMNVLAHDIFYDEEFIAQNKIEKKNSLTDLLKSSDFVTVHVPLTGNTRQLIGEQELIAMKPGSYLINASRGGVVDEKALLDALESKRIAGAALDVLSKEPPFEDKILGRLIAHPNVIVTPHIAAFTKQDHHAIGLRVLKNVIAFYEDRPDDIDRVS